MGSASELLLAHRHHRRGAPPGTPEPAGVSPLLCRGVSSLYCAYKRESDNSDSGKIATIGEYHSGLPGNGLRGYRVTLRVLIDSNIYDKFIDPPCILNRILELIRIGKIELLQPQIIRSQLAEMTDIRKRDKLLSIPTRAVPGDGFLAGYSGAGDRVGAGSGRIKIDDILTKKKPTRGHIEDALIATTAVTEADAFVTEDKRLGNKMRSAKLSIQLWTFADFESHLSHLT